MRIRYVLSLLLIVAHSAPLIAQQQSAMVDLVRRAHNALNDLDYANAESIGRGLLALGDDATQSDQLLAYQLLAAALYPEETFAQRPDSAANYLRMLIQIQPDAEMPRDISWPGLDSLLDVARREIFAVSAYPVPQTIVAGTDAAELITVKATRPTRFTFRLESVATGESVVIDSIGPTTVGAFRMRAVKNNELRLPSGHYGLFVTATDTKTGRSVETPFDVEVDAPPLQLIPVPTALDSTKLLPEETKVQRGKNVLIGVGLGAATALAANAFRGSGPVSQASGDSRAYVIAGGITLGAVAGAFIDRSKPLPRNIAHNAKLRADFAQNVRDAQDENARRLTNFNVTIVTRGR